MPVSKLSKDLALLIHTSIICLITGLSLTGIGAIWLLKFEVFVDEDHSKLPTRCWLPILHKIPFKSRFIANCSSCSTSELSIILTSCLTEIKNHVIKYCI